VEAAMKPNTGLRMGANVQCESFQLCKIFALANTVHFYRYRVRQSHVSTPKQPALGFVWKQHRNMAKAKMFIESW
jgi:hypothetical protein